MEKYRKERGNKRKEYDLPSPLFPLQATSLSLIAACSSGVGSRGGGAGYPFGNRVRLAVRVLLMKKFGERYVAKRCGRSLRRNLSVIITFMR
jgi:hypothetical protein